MAERARVGRRAGDLLVLAEEAPTTAQMADAWIDAAEILRADGQSRLAAEQVERALALDSGNARARRELERCRHARAAAGGSGRRVFLFSGHMVDAPGRAQPRFPAEKVEAAAARIDAALALHGAGSGDIGLTQGANGGDLLFTESCQRRGVAAGWLEPFDEDEFIARSVAPGGEEWLRRYRRCRAGLSAPPRLAPTELGLPPQGRDSAYPFERCNLWLLYSALAHGPQNVHLICLWNGDGGDGPGGTAHMVREVKHRAGQVEWIDTRTL